MTEPKTRTFRNPNGSRRSGVVSVEMAMCLPVLFLLLFGCYEVANANMLHHAAENAAYEAARAGIVPGATAQKCRDQAALILRGMGIQQFNVTVTPGTLQRNTATVIINVDVPLTGNALISPVFFGGVTFHGGCEMIREVL